MVSILTISGMVAVHSKRAVFTALAGVPGVKSAEVELGRAVVDHEPQASDEAIAAAIEAAGCSVTSIERITSRPLPLHRRPSDVEGA